VYAGIIAIGLAAFLFRWLLTMLERRLFPRAGAHPVAEPAAGIPVKARAHGE
jgi:hypothetical protein